MKLRRVTAILLSSVLLAEGPAGSPSFAASASPGPDELARQVCSVPRTWLVRTLRGYRPDRSPELTVIPKEPGFIGTGLPHTGPWDYVERVPMLWYGPGYIRPAGRILRPVTVADIAPTQARLLRFRFDAPDGKPMAEALALGGDRPRPPRLIVTLVWDSAGRAVLNEWPEAWPTVRSLIPRGAWYENATIGSSPTSTAQDHATIGTGAFPDDHGIVGHRLRIGGRITTPWVKGPSFLMRPTLADLYDRAMGNRPLVGGLASVNIHLGMVGHGAMWGGGDRDLAVLRAGDMGRTIAAEGDVWNLTRDVQALFRFPAYVNDLPPLTSYFPTTDRLDGTADGTWRGNDMASEELLGGFHTPARIPYQTRVIEEVIRREGFGRDDVPDLLFINYKLIDEIGHIFSMNSVEMEDTLRVQDEYLQRLIAFLDREVGRGRWVMVLTADHGATPDPAVSGGIVISPGRLAAAIESEFDTDGDDVRVVELVQPTNIFVNTAELEANGSSLEEVAGYVSGLTAAQVAEDVSAVPVSGRGQRVFATAFPTSLLSRLPCLSEGGGD